MTPKQKFMKVFLEEVFGFTDVEFVPSYASWMEVKGIYNVQVKVPSHYLLMKDTVRKEETVIFIFVDKLKSGGYSIKFKTRYNYIPEDRFDRVLERVYWLYPNAKANIYYRTGMDCFDPDGVPTLGLTVSKLPWK